MERKTMENNYQAIQQDKMALENSNPPPSYNNIQQSNASAPPQPEFNITSNITTNAPHILPINIPRSVGPKSMEMTCPSCQCRIKTTVRHKSTSKTHIACILLSWTCICCCLPYCMDSCRNANHFCPMCGTFIGTYTS